MPESTATNSESSSRLKSAMESSSVKFHIKAGNAKWACTLHDRTAYERQKAARESSAASISTTGSDQTAASK